MLPPAIIVYLHYIVIIYITFYYKLLCRPRKWNFSPVNKRIIQECCCVVFVFVNPSYL